TLDFLLRTSVVALVHTLPQPPICNPYQVSHRPGLASSAFARHYSRNHMLFSLPVGTEMFHFPTFPPRTLYIQVRVTGDEACRVSPFGNPRINVWLSTPRGLSQIPTSFFGSWCQGIHRAPLKTYSHKDARVHCTVLNIRPGPPRANRPTSTHPPPPQRGRPARVWDDPGP